MPDNSFDVVSKIDLNEVSNAIQQALKEIHTRFDLKDSKSNIELEKDAIVLHSADEYRSEQDRSERGLERHSAGAQGDSHAFRLEGFEVEYRTGKRCDRAAFRR